MAEIAYMWCTLAQHGCRIGSQRLAPLGHPKIESVCAHLAICVNRLTGCGRDCAFFWGPPRFWEALVRWGVFGNPCAEVRSEGW